MRARNFITGTPTLLAAWAVALVQLLQPTLAAWAMYAALGGALSTMPKYAYADPFSDAAVEGQTEASNALGSFVFPDFMDSGVVSEADKDSGAVFFAPDFFSGYGPGASASFEAFHGDNPGIADETIIVQGTLSGGSSMEAQAYQTISDAANRSHPNMINDPIWITSDNVLTANSTVWDDIFTGCSTSSIVTDSGNEVHVPDFRTCERVISRTPSCELERTVHVTSYGVPCGAQVEYRISGGQGISVKVHCTATEIIVEAFDAGGWGCYSYWSGSPVERQVPCQRSGFARLTKDPVAQVISPGVKYFDGEQSYNTCISDPEADPWMAVRTIQSAYGPECFGVGRGYHLLPNPLDNENLLFHNWARRSLFLYLSGGGCSFIDGYEQCALSFRFYDLHNHDDSYYAPVVRDATVTFASPPTVTDTIAQIPSGCMADAVSDSFCTGSWVCLDQDNARLWDSVTVTPGLHGPSLTSMYPGDNPSANICYRAEYQYDCSGFNQGSLDCYLDTNGVLQCPDNTGDIPNTCGPLEDAGCAFVSSECTEGSLDPMSNICYVLTDTYDCGSSVGVAGYSIENSINCSGPIRCMGTDCIDHTDENNDGFLEAAAYLEMLNFMAANDKNCVIDAGTGDIECTIFTGEALHCKKAVGGVVDCCDQPGGVSASDYMALAMASWKLMEKMEALDKLATAGLDIPGAWDSLTSPMTAVWNDVKQPFISAFESAFQTTGGGAAVDATSITLDGIKTDLTIQVAEWTASVFGEDAASMFFQQGTDGAFTGALSGPLSAIMTAYMIYAIAVIIINIIWECEEEEYQLGVKRALKTCHYVGSYCASSVLGVCIEKREGYCCFQSPIARIMQEQIRPQIAMSWGTAESPSCGGLSITALAAADWSLIDMSEWVGLLTQSGVIPSNFADAATRFSLDSLADNPNITETVPNSLDRIQERMQEGVEPEVAREKIRQDLW